MPSQQQQLHPPLNVRGQTQQLRLLRKLQIRARLCLERRPLIQPRLLSSQLGKNGLQR